MESSNSQNIKKAFQSFTISTNYQYSESEPLIAPENSRLLFNISGGVKYQDELLGLKESSEDRVGSIQKCIRTDGMNSIGYSGRHHLFFEMLGHFMFYAASEKETKEEFIKFAYDFLIKEVGLAKDRIFATVHPQDEITLDIWKKLGNENIILSDSNTFISPYADKSALRTEIKWQKKDEEQSLVELWNLVFTQFDSKELFINQSNKIAADSGASLERIVSAYEDKLNNYENSMWSEYITYLTSIGRNANIEEYRRLADFFNTSAQMINEGILPGNKVQPYMLRKMLRTIFDMCETLELNYEDFISEYYKYNQMQISNIDLLKVIKEEFERYQIAIQRGLVQAQKMIQKNKGESVTFEYLKSTCGLPERYIHLLLNMNKNEQQKKYIKQ